MRNVLFILIFAAIMAGCSGGLVKSGFHATDDGVWNKGDTIAFSFSEMDTVKKHNMFINVRNDATFAYSNLFLITELEFPTGETLKDTLQYEMALPDGTWLGKGLGGIKENKLWYKEDIVFPAAGVYKLRISQAMRKNGKVGGIVNLQGITDVGYQVEKSEE